MLGGAALELKIAILQYRYVGPGQAKVQRAGNDSRAGSLDSPALGGVERKERPVGKQAPPSGVLLGGLSKYPRAGAVSLDALPIGKQAATKEGANCFIENSANQTVTTLRLELIFPAHGDRPRELPARWRTIPGKTE
jgi:hypothetical protein